MSKIEKPAVLLVDDNDGTCTLVRALLQREFFVDVASDGAIALEKLQHSQYAAILLDLRMPVLDGFGVLEAIESDELAPQPVVLVITGGDRAAVERLGAHRVHGVVRKPFDAEDLANVVVACAEIRERSNFETMAIATMLAGGPFLALLNRLP